jgi:cytochrome c oxidase subunit II
MQQLRRRVCWTVLIAGLVLACGVDAGHGQDAPVREFTMLAKKYAFEPDRIEVFEGDTVRLILSSADTDHGLGIKKLKLQQDIPKGETVTMEFVAREAGSFEITCSEWCGKGHKKMKGMLVVQPRGDTKE